MAACPASDKGARGGKRRDEPSVSWHSCGPLLLTALTVALPAVASGIEGNDSEAVRPFAFAQADGPLVEPCGGLAEDSVCLKITFPGQTGSTKISCGVWKRGTLTEPPSWPDFMPAAQVQCDMARPCNYLVQTVKSKEERTYDAFCVTWGENFVPPFQVFPQCSAGHCGVKVSTIAASKERRHEAFGLEDLAVLLLLLTYVAWSFLFEKIRVLHETGAAVILGIMCGSLLHMSGETASFSYDMFTYTLLPMVIFAAGFNLRKGKFFRYAAYIITLGVTGTVLIFLFIFFGSRWFTLESRQMSVSHRLIMASVLASTDTVAPMAFLPATTFPHIYAVVFGEGVLNDVVSILLSSSVSGMDQLPSLWALALKILVLFVKSFIIGAVFGLATSMIFKRSAMWSHGVLKPTVLLLCLNYCCYIISEMWDISSIFALFVCALLCGHYARYSLSVEAQAFAREFSELLAYVAEAVVFGYFGLTAVAYIAKGAHFHVTLILSYILCIILARICAVGVLALLLHFLQGGGRPDLTTKELCVVSMAGCMRGTIAYALVLRAVPPEAEQSAREELLVTTVLGIVLVNCLLFGGLFPLVMKALRLEPHVASVLDQPLGQQREGDASWCEGVLAPGAEAQGRNRLRTMRVGLHRAWHKVDDRWLKPYFRPAVTTGSLAQTGQAELAEGRARDDQIER